MLGQLGPIMGGRPSIEDTDPIDLARGLGAARGGAARVAEGEAAEEGAPVIYSDDLIRAHQQRRRDREAERLGGLEVDDQFVLARRLHGEGGRAGAPEDLVDVNGGAAELLGEARRVGHEAAHLGDSRTSTCPAAGARGPARRRAAAP